MGDMIDWEHILLPTWFRKWFQELNNMKISIILLKNSFKCSLVLSAIVLTKHFVCFRCFWFFATITFTESVWPGQPHQNSHNLFRIARFIYLFLCCLPKLCSSRALSFLCSALFRSSRFLRLAGTLISAIFDFFQKKKGSESSMFP